MHVGWRQGWLCLEQTEVTSQLLESAFDNVVTRLMTIDIPLKRMLSSKSI
jgi:hypothetical protein